MLLSHAAKGKGCLGTHWGPVQCTRTRGVTVSQTSKLRKCVVHPPTHLWGEAKRPRFGPRGGPVGGDIGWCGMSLWWLSLVHEPGGPKYSEGRPPAWQEDAGP